MSNPISPRLAAARTRMPHLAEAATVRARLALVPARASSAPRTPFVALLAAVLVAGVVGLLMFNTHMQQNAFAASDLKRTSERLTAQQQQLNLELQQLRDPQRLAIEARKLGMVIPDSPAFLRLSDGEVVGVATPASPESGLFVRNFKAVKPTALTPPPRIVRVPAVITPRKTSPADGRASAGSSPAEGRKKSADRDG
jgi:4-amino-4-deoxy-L-arabinose transferase-like glycosyltransferase